MLRVRRPNTDRLINEETLELAPRLRVIFGLDLSIVLGWVAPAFEKVGKEVVCIDVDVYDLTEPSQKVDFLIRTGCRGKKGETSVVYRGEGGEVFEGCEETRIICVVRVVSRGWGLEHP